MTKPTSCACSDSLPEGGSLASLSPHFAEMVDRCLAHAERAVAAGRHVVGIMCEFTPREIIMAAGGEPVCLCGGSDEMVAPAERYLPANLCPLIKSTFGYHCEKENPFLEMASLVVGETTCDGKKKMFELMGESRPMHILELPQKQGDPDAWRHWLSQITRFKKALESLFGTRVTNKKLNAAITTMNRERRLRLALADLMRLEVPPLTGRELLDLKSLISGIPEDFTEYERLMRELQGRKGRSAGAVRVLLTGTPMAHGAERVLDIVESKGGLVVALESCSGLKPILATVAEDTPKPLEAIARHYFEQIPCPVLTPNRRRFDSLRRLAADFRPECVVELVWHACATYDVESRLVRRFSEKELGLPYLKIDTDYSSADDMRIGVRIEALYEGVKAKRGISSKAELAHSPGGLCPGV